MKIHSKFRDYYDSVQAHGQDDTVHFVRNVEELEYSRNLQTKLFDSVRQITITYLQDKKTELVLKPFVVLFCGKVFRGFKAAHYHRVERTTVDLGEFFYDKESALKFYTDNTSEEKRRYYSLWHELSDQKNIENWMTKQNFDEVEDFAVQNKIVVAYADKGHLIKNVCLSDYSFYKIVDPFSAYQELDMFISGVLSRDPNMMVEISDKHKIAEHGFDKWSFRKMPTKHKVEE